MSTVWFSNGPTPQFAELLNEISRTVELRVVHLGSGDQGRGWGDLDVRYEYSTAPQGGLRAFVWGIRTAGSRKVTRIVSLGYSAPVAMGLLLIARLRRMPVYTLSDSSFLHEERKPTRVRFAKRMILSLLLAKSTRVWTIGTDNARYWSYYGFYNQVRTRFESPIPAEPSEGNRGPIDSDPSNRILFVGRLAPVKGLHLAVAAGQSLRDAGKDVLMTVVGPGAIPADIEHTPWVDFVGPVPRARLASYLVNAGVLVVPSLREPYGLVVREALQFGLPVVASRVVPAALELCDRGWNIVDPTDSEEFGSAIARALNDGRWDPLAVEDMKPFYLSELAR